MDFPQGREADAPSGTFHHWAIFNIPADRHQLPESLETGPEATGLKYGRNDFGNARYDGPQPPEGHGPHRYRFRLAALDVPSLGVPATAAAEQIWNEARKHLRDETELVGVYQR